MNCAEFSAVELELAQQVVSAIGPDLMTESVCEDEETIRINLRPSNGSRLASLVFSREGLRKLGEDPKRGVKIEYLRKDIARAAESRREYRYPHSLGMRF